MPSLAYAVLACGHALPRAAAGPRRLEVEAPQLFWLSTAVDAFVLGVRHRRYWFTAIDATTALLPRLTTPSLWELRPQIKTLNLRI